MSKEELSIEFLNHVSKHFKQIRLSFKRQFPKKFCPDSLTDSIVKVHNKISKTGFIFNTTKFSGDSFIDFLFLTYKNEVMNDTTGDLLHQKKMNRNIDLSNEDYGLPDSLISDEVEGLEKEQERLFEDLIIDQIFDFAEKNFTALEVGFFKMYFKNKLSLKEISELTNYPKTFVWQNVNVVKQSVLKEFQNINLPNRTNNKNK